MLNKLFKLKLVFFAVISLVVICAAVSPVLAENLFYKSLNTTAGGSGYKITDTTTPAAYIGVIINYIASLLGVIFFVLVWMGAFDIIGAGGNEEQVKKGRLRIKNGAIGMLIVFSAFVLTKLILVIASGNGLFIIGGDKPPQAPFI
ncbi:MAG: hypothetical protein WCK11_04235 [Candidatus Falkowbacteria bacterium]